MEACRIDGLASVLVDTICSRFDPLERSVDLGDLVSDVGGQPDVGVGFRGARTRITGKDPDCAVVAMFIEEFVQRSLQPLTFIVQTAPGLTKIRARSIVVHAVSLDGGR